MELWQGWGSPTKKKHLLRFYRFKESFKAIAYSVVLWFQTKLSLEAISYDDGVPHHSRFARHGHSKHLDVHLFSIVTIVLVGDIATTLPGIATTLPGISTTLPGGARPAQ